ncbi:MAG: hypothetical protein RLZZ373_3813 [Pseudomonadota bacterium]|jgi:hypothetical protein
MSTGRDPASLALNLFADIAGMADSCMQVPPGPQQR